MKRVIRHRHRIFHLDFHCREEGRTSLIVVHLRFDWASERTAIDPISHWSRGAKKDVKIHNYPLHTYIHRYRYKWKHMQSNLVDMNYEMGSYGISAFFDLAWISVRRSGQRLTDKRGSKLLRHNQAWWAPFSNEVSFLPSSWMVWYVLIYYHFFLQFEFPFPFLHEKNRNIDTTVPPEKTASLSRRRPIFFKMQNGR